MANQKAQALTDKTILAFKKPEAKKWVRDGGGLSLCLTPKEKGAWRHWYFIYVSPETGKRSYKPLGAYPDLGLSAAREMVKVLGAEVLKKVDPMAEEMRTRDAKVKAVEDVRLASEVEKGRVTVAELCAEYIERHAKPHKRSWAKDKDILDRDVIPVWGERKAEDISKRDVLRLLESIVDRGAPAMANNCFAVVRKMFNFAMERDILLASPCTRLKSPSPKPVRERTLSEAEIRAFWHNLDRCAMSDEVRRVLKLVLVTAQRSGEVIGMHAGEIGGRWWTIPGERVKNGKTHRVYLTDTALALIGDTEGRGYIFPAPSTKTERAMAPQALIVALNRNMAWPVTDKKGEPLFGKDGKPATENRLEVEHFTSHDLRRTAATFMAQAREMDEVIDAVLNHSKRGVIRVYNQYRYDREKQQALETWERMLLGIITGTTGKVVPIGNHKKYQEVA